jgi:hypothetical protein
MKKIFLCAAMLFAVFFIKAQTTTISANEIKANRRFNLDGIWRTSFPGNNAGDVISGGVVTWLNGLTFAVTSAEYNIKNKVYLSNSGTITLDAAHPTLQRIDVIGLNTAGQIVKVTGTPSVNPLIPQVNPAIQVYLTAIIVNAGATSAGVNQLIIYDEDNEWAHVDGGFTSINFANTTTPQSGSVSIACTGSGDIKFANGSTNYNYSDYNVLRFYLRLSTALPNSASVSVGVSNGEVGLTPITQAHGFNPSQVNTWQNISIPLSDLNRSGATFTAFYLTVTGATTTYRIDNIQLQGSSGNGTGEGYLTEIFKRNDSVFYKINSNTIFAYIDGGGGGGSLTLNGQTGGTQTFATSSSGSNFGITSSGNTHTFSLPDAGFSSRGLINTTSQTILGVKSFPQGITVGSLRHVGEIGSSSNLRFGSTLSNLIAGSLNNLSIGNNTANTQFAGSFNLFIGHNIAMQSPTQNNSISIGDGNKLWLYKDSSGTATINTGDLRYNVNYINQFTSRSLVDKNYVDSFTSKTIADSSFAVDTSLSAAVNILNPISSTLLKSRGLANSGSITWQYNSNGDIIGNTTSGGGTFSGSIAANQIAYGTAANTLSGNNNLYTNGNALSIGTTDLSRSFQILTANGGDAFKMHSTDPNCDIVGSSSASSFEGSNRLRFADGVKIITNATDALHVKQNQNIKLFGGVEFTGKQDITTGTATTIAGNVYNIFVNPTSVLSSHTITMPTNLSDGQELNIFFGGTIATGAPVVTSLTIDAGAGKSMYEFLTPTTANGGDVLTYIYNATTNLIYRKK